MLPLLTTGLLVVVDIAATASAQTRLSLITAIAARRAAVEVAFGERDAAAIATRLIRREFPQANVGVSATTISGIPMTVVAVKVDLTSIVAFTDNHVLSAISHAPVEIP